MERMRVRLSILWIFAMLNYLYCDVITLMDPRMLRGFVAGTAGGFQITEGFLLGAGVLMEIPIGMVLVSAIVSSHAVNRWANIAAGAVMTVVQLASLFSHFPPASYYLFFSAVEILTTAIVVWSAWKWAGSEARKAIEADGSPLEHPAT